MFHIRTALSRLDTKELLDGILGDIMDWQEVYSTNA